MKNKKTIAKIVRGASILSGVVAASSFFLSPTDAAGYCQDRQDEAHPNYGFCTVDPNYNNGEQFCKPGGVTCDGD